MKKVALAEQLAFVVTLCKVNEEAIFAQAFSKGLQLLYIETQIEAYLLGTVSREQALNTLGIETIKEVDYQRDALKHDV